MEERAFAHRERQGVPEASYLSRERKFFIANLLVRIHYIIVMMKWTGLAPWEFEFPVPSSLTCEEGLVSCMESLISVPTCSERKDCIKPATSKCT